MLDHDNLEEFADGANYDQEDQSDTGVAFYAALAHETGGPVLELACGTGRVSIPIARLGLAVTGLDIVPAMLDQARTKSADLSVRWIEGDARTFALGEQFRLIFLTGNAFQGFLSNADQGALLRQVRAHLHPEGVFAFETRNPLLASPQSPEGGFVSLAMDEEELVSASFIDTLGHEVRLIKAHRYDHLTQLMHWTTERHWNEDGEARSKTTRIALRYTFPQELAALLAYNGFHILRQYSDWDLQPLSATSPSIIVVCGLAGREPSAL